MGNAVVYVHGKGGNAAEAAHYESLFHLPVLGFDYHAGAPWEAREEFTAHFTSLGKEYGRVILVANSIGAYFSMCMKCQDVVEKAFFISPVTDMERLITDLMRQAGVNEEELLAKGEITTASGETLSADYLRYVRENRPSWRVTTHILRGGRDTLVACDAVTAFAKAHHATLTVMEEGGHWFHTEKEMAFLDGWLRRLLPDITL